MAIRPERHPADAQHGRDNEPAASAQDDPLMELARLLDENAPPAPGEPEPIGPDPSAFAPTTMPFIEKGETGDVAAGGNAERQGSIVQDPALSIEPLIAEPVAVENQPSPGAFDPEADEVSELFEPEPIAPVDLSRADSAVVADEWATADPAPVTAATEPVQQAPSLEDELAQLLGGSTPEPAMHTQAMSAGPIPIAEPAPALQEPSSEPDWDPAGATDPHDVSTVDDSQTAGAAMAFVPAFSGVVDAEPVADTPADMPADTGAGWRAFDAASVEGDERASSDPEAVPQWPFDEASFDAPQSDHDDHGLGAQSAPMAPSDVQAPAGAELTSDDIDLAFEEAFDAELTDLEALSVDEPTIGDAPAQAPEQPAVDVAPTQPEPPLDPVDELAAIIGYQAQTSAETEPQGQTSLQVEAESQTDPLLDDLDLAFEDALEQEFADTDNADAQLSFGATEHVPPALDTVDMSGYDATGPATFDVPELAAELNEPRGQADIDVSGDDTDLNIAPTLGVGVAAAGAVASMGAARHDTAGFEDDLIRDMERDMEFVGHDRDTASQAGAQLPPFEDTGVPDDTLADERHPGARRGMMIAAVVGAVAIAGIAAAFLLTGGQSGEQDGPVLVEAEPGPTKIEPDDPGGTTVPNQDRAVFDADGGTAPAQQQLVSTTEEPIDIATPGAGALPPAVTEGEKSEDRLLQGGTETATEQSAEPITPRRVRTLIVRPDGTLVERPAQVTATAPTPQATTSPATPSQATSEPTQTAAAPATPAADQNTQSAALVPAPAAAAQPPEQTPAPVVRPVETTAAAPAANTPSPPVIRDRPASQPVNVVNRTQPQQVAATPAPATPAPAAPAAATANTPQLTTGSTDGFVVQLAALPSEDQARATATNLSQRYGGLIGGRGLVIQRADIEGRGTFYRVRVAANDRADANGLCNQIKSAGGNCFVAR